MSESPPPNARTRISRPFPWMTQSDFSMRVSRSASLNGPFSSQVAAVERRGVLEAHAAIHLMGCKNLGQLRQHRRVVRVAGLRRVRGGKQLARQRGGIKLLVILKRLLSKTLRAKTLRAKTLRPEEAFENLRRNQAVIHLLVL